VTAAAVLAASLPRASSARPWRRALGWLAFLGPFFYLTYGAANWLASLRGTVPSVVFAWERQLPFWPWTVFPYWSINAFYALSLFLCASRHVLDRHALRLLTAQVLAVACFIAAPLAFSFGQPSVDGAAGWLFAALRGFDKPFNQAPSLHIALALILWDLYRRLLAAAWARTLLHSWTLLVCVSVLTTYQHHFFDIPTGAALGLLCIWAWPLERRAPPWRAWRWTREPQRRRIGLRYGVAALLLLALAVCIGGAALWLVWLALALGFVAANYLALGARGFAKHRGEGTTWALRWLLAPYRWAAWLNSRWWTRGQPSAVPLAGGVWIGRLPGRGAQGPWESTLDLTAELDAPAGVPTLRLPALDLVTPTPSWLLRAAHALEAQRARHGSVLAFCALGYSRSAATAAVWLLVSGRARDSQDAVRLVRAVRPAVVLDAPLCAAIEAAWRQSGGVA
jgi:protein-tyrosine phosphatase/membrane-associated phospholipid phosphatase